MEYGRHIFHSKFQIDAIDRYDFLLGKPRVNLWSWPLTFEHLDFVDSLFIKSHVTTLSQNLRIVSYFNKRICMYIPGAPIKNNPLEKILYLRNCSRFFHQIYAVYRGGFRPCIHQMAFKYLAWFQNYNYLNLKVHFLSKHVIKLWFWHKNYIADI